MTMMSVVVGPNGASMQTFDGFKAATRERAKEEADLQDSQTIALPHFIIGLLQALVMFHLWTISYLIFSQYARYERGGVLSTLKMKPTNSAVGANFPGENASGESSLLSFQRKCKQNVSCFCWNIQNSILQKSVQSWKGGFCKLGLLEIGQVTFRLILTPRIRYSSSYSCCSVTEKTG